MSNNAAVPVLDAGSIRSLTDEQIVAWYAKHPNAIVRALVERIAYNDEKHKGELIGAYQQGVQAYNAHNLTPEELRLGAVYAEG